MKRLFVTIGLLTLVGGAATNVAAQTPEAEGVTELRLDVPTPEDVSGDLRAETREMIAEKVKPRIRKRLTAAGVKFTTVAVEEDGVVLVEADPDHDVATIRGIVVPPGRFSVRVVRSIGTRWVDLSDRMPSGLELRTGEDPMDRDATYVWSKSREKLEAFLEEVSIADGDVTIYSTGGGWRTVTLGETLATHEDVQSSEIKRVQTGAPFVALELSPSAQASFDELAEPEGMDFAAVLDGEVVSLMSASALSEHLFSIPPPDYLSGFESLMHWARQVAGRLGARIPVELVPL